MTRGIGLALWALAVIGIGGQAAAQADQSTAQAQGTVFQKQEIDQLSSPFSKPTVLKLNAIVARSKMTIDSYDAMLPAIRSDIAKARRDRTASAKGHAAMARLIALSARARAALTDMNMAEAHLKASGEPYNSAILQGMVDFVTKVDSEIGAQRRQLSATLAKR